MNEAALEIIETLDVGPLPMIQNATGIYEDLRSIIFDHPGV